MHLISPISIGSDRLCTISGSLSHTVGRPWRTVSVLVDGARLDNSEEDDKWVLYEDPDSGGIVTFGTCCISTYKIRFAIDVDADDADVLIKLNGNVVWAYTKSFKADPFDGQPNAIFEDVLIDLVAGTVKADAIRGPNNTGGNPGDVHTPDIGISIPFAPARDNPCGNVWEISAALPVMAGTPVHAGFEILDVT